jgi:hypothetical protein
MFHDEITNEFNKLNMGIIGHIDINMIIRFVHNYIAASIVTDEQCAVVPIVTNTAQLELLGRTGSHYYVLTISFVIVASRIEVRESAHANGRKWFAFALLVYGEMRREKFDNGLCHAPCVIQDLQTKAGV